MNVFRRRRVATRAFHDIVAKPRQRVVRLRERTWKLELSASALAAGLRRHWVRSSFAALMVVALVVGLLRGVGRANIATLYATSCLGGWTNPQLAEGEPDLPPGADAELFTAKNSAVLDGALAQIYCGGFKGEVPPDATPKRVVLNLSWAVVGSGVPAVPSGPGGGASPAPVPEVLNVDVQATPEQQVEALLQASEASEAVTVQQQAPPPEPVPAPEPAAEPTPEPAAAEVSALPFIAVAHAQDEVQPVPEAPAAAPEILESVEPSVGAQNVAPLPPQTDPTAEPAPPVPEGLKPAESVPVDTEPAFLEIAYTLDGSTWQTVAKVTAQSWRKLAVELPLESWDELAKLQVSLQAVPTVAEQPQVLLDSLYLAVTYGSDAADVQDQPDFSRDTIVQLLADEPNQLVRTFSVARQRQQLWVYQNSGSGAWYLVAEEPELDPLANATLRGSTVVWVSAGAGSLVASEIGSGVAGSVGTEADGTAELRLSDGAVAKWNGSLLTVVNSDGSPADVAAAKDATAFLAELHGPAAVAATTTAPVSAAPAADVPLDQPAAEPTVNQGEPSAEPKPEPAPAEGEGGKQLLPPEQPSLTAE